MCRLCKLAQVGRGHAAVFQVVRRCGEEQAARVPESRPVLGTSAERVLIATLQVACPGNTPLATCKGAGWHTIGDIISKTAANGTASCTSVPESTGTSSVHTSEPRLLREKKPQQKDEEQNNTGK